MERECIPYFLVYQAAINSNCLKLLAMYVKLNTLDSFNEVPVGCACR